MDLSQKKSMQILAWGVGLVTVFITPWFSYDPLNVSRMLLLLVLSATVFILVLPRISKIHIELLRKPTILLTLFVLQMTLVLIFAPGNKWQQIFGTSGRQTGFLTYLALVLLLFVAMVLSSGKLLKMILQALVVAGVLSIMYGFIQSLGADPIGWTNPYSPVFGFFGNPNFFSAFMGFGAAAVSAFIVSREFNILWRLLSSVFVVSTLYLIKASNSQQGFLVFGFGVAVLLTILFYKTENLRKFRIPALSGMTLGIVLVVLDILQKSPWQSILYKPSVSYRGDYWRAGWKMTSDHPFFGVGLDSYRDWFFRSRDLVTASRPEAKKFTDSAHNVLFDFSANGGVPLLLLYLALLMLTLFAALRILKRAQEFDPYFVAIFLIWVGYTAQSLISINHIGLAVWGWLSAGLIIGYEVNTRTTLLDVKKSKLKTDLIIHPIGIPLRIGAGVSIGLALGLPAFLADANFRSSIDSRNIERITATAYKWPQDVVRMNYIADLFSQNNLPEKSLEIAQDAVKHFPNSFFSWKIIYDSPNSSEQDKFHALEMMKMLNPFDPELIDQ
jgi:O-antigen ligase